MTATPAAQLFALLDREIWLLTAAAGARRGGLIATSVSSASLAPALPRVLVSLARQHHTWELVEASEAFALHLLGEDQLDLVWRFGLQSGHDVDKLAGLPHTSAATGSPILAGVIGWLDCRVEARLETGDRTVYLAEILEAQEVRAAAPLTLTRLLQVAPPETLRILKEQAARAGEAESNAIRAWRQQRQASP